MTPTNPHLVAECTKLVSSNIGPTIDFISAIVAVMVACFIAYRLGKLDKN